MLNHSIILCSSSQQNLMLVNLLVSQNILQVRRWMLNDEMMKLEGAPLDMHLLLFLCKVLVKSNLHLSPLPPQHAQPFI